MIISTNIKMIIKRSKPKSLAINLLRITIASLCLTSCSNIKIDSNPESPSQTSKETITAINSTITLANVTHDVSYLASDELKGRDNFSHEIHTAANFIAKRFKEVGLTPAQNTQNFKQQYSIQRITPNTLNVEINGKTIDSNALLMATTVIDFNWNSHSQAHLRQDNSKQNAPINNLTVNTRLIGEKDNMRKVLRELNNQGGQHLVLLHPKHEKSFKRYQSYLADGLTSLVNEAKNKLGGIIVIALTDISTINQFSVKGYATVTHTKLSNVVGILPGKSKANEIVLYSAHYDHLGVKPSTQSESKYKTDKGSHIFNGADDDASGVSAIISLADHFTKTGNNERTLMFSAFSAEEIGGFGSRYFSNQIDPNTITAMINIEMIGKPSIFGDGNIWMTGMDRSNLGEQLNQALAPQHLKMYADPYPKQNLFYRSDNATLARLGVPAHSFSSVQLDKDQHYHQVTDDVKSLHLPSMLQAIKVLAIATTPLVNGAVAPSRIDPNKIKRKGLIY